MHWSDWLLLVKNRKCIGNSFLTCIVFLIHTNRDIVLNYDSLDTCNERFRRAFEYELLSQDLVLERETAIDGKSETFLKILCPFETLSQEAELIRLYLPLKSHRFQSVKRLLSQPVRKSILNCNRWKSLDESRRLQLLTGQYKRKKLNHFLGNYDCEILAVQHLFTNSQRNLLVILSNLMIDIDYVGLWNLDAYKSVL